MSVTLGSTPVFDEQSVMSRLALSGFESAIYLARCDIDSPLEEFG